jgi:hypothetical protein
MKQLLEHPIIEGYVPVIRKAIGLGSQLDEVKFMSSFVFVYPNKVNNVEE